MAATTGTGTEALALSAGYALVADDGVVGEVETPLFAPDHHEPDYLVVRLGGGGAARRPVVPCALVARVDASARVVRVHGARADLAALPDHLPLAP